MERHITVVSHGQVPLTPEMQKALSIPDGTSVSLTVEEGNIVVRPVDFDPIVAMQDLFAGAKYSLEDDLMQMRREEAEDSQRKYGC